MLILEYGPADLASQFSDAAGTTLAYVGVSVSAALALFFIFFGIWKGLAFFHHLASEGGGGGAGGGSDSSWSPSNSYEAYEDGGHEGKAAFDSGTWSSFDAERTWDDKYGSATDLTERDLK